jgi:hypothetical protein
VPILPIDAQLTPNIALIQRRKVATRTPILPPGARPVLAKRVLPARSPEGVRWSQTARIGQMPNTRLLFRVAA